MNKYRFNPFNEETRGFFKNLDADINYFKKEYSDVVHFFNLPEINQFLKPLDLVGLIDFWQKSSHHHIIECMLFGLFLAGVDVIATEKEIEKIESKYKYLGSISPHWLYFWEKI